MPRNKYAFIVEGLIKGMNRGVHPVEYLRSAGYDSPLDVLGSISRILEKRHHEISQNAYNMVSYGALLKAGILIYSNKFKSDFKRLRKARMPEYKIKEKLGVTKYAIEKAKEAFEPRTVAIDKVSADNDNKLIDGLEFKVGLHGHAYYKSGSEWIKSSRTARELRL